MKWITGICFALLLGCQGRACGGSCASPEDPALDAPDIPGEMTSQQQAIASEADEGPAEPGRSTTVVIVPMVGGTAPKPTTIVVSESGARVVDEPVVVYAPETADIAERLAEEPVEPVPVSPVSGEPDELASVPEPEQSADPTVSSELDPDPTTPEIEVEQPAVNIEPIPWLEQYRTAYAQRQIALSDVTTALANPQVGVYFEDHRAAGEVDGTPHMVWLAGADVQVVSPTVESLLIGRHSERWGYVATFTCDPSRYVCRSLDDAPIGAYFRFAPLGSAQIVTLVGVLWFDPGERSARVGARISAFDRIIDARLDDLE